MLLEERLQLSSLEHYQQGEFYVVTSGMPCQLTT
jgi:hypothetical protein